VINLLADEPMVLLGTVLVAGALLGAIRVRGVSLGPAGALFAGLAASALDERLVIPSIVGLVGLALFTYCIGLSTGGDFVRTLRRSLSLMASIAVVMLALAALARALGSVFDLSRAETAGMYAGALTNTPALAGAQSLLPDVERSAPVVGYALTYPFGVVGMLIAVTLGRRLTRADSPVESFAPGLASMTVRVGEDRPQSIGGLAGLLGADAVITRIQRDDQQWVPTPADELRINDVLAVTCRPDRAEMVAATVGRRLPINITDSRRELDFRRIVISNNAIVGLPIAALDLTERFGATITRVKRGRHETLATPDFVLEPGDRVRVVAPPHTMDAVARTLGDDEQRVAEFSPPGFTLGLFAGLLVGLIPVTIPSVGEVRLGAAGGPLVIGLLLGWRHRTGPLIWQVPHGVSVTLRQLGALLFLGMAGTSGGAALRSALGRSEALAIAASGMVITALSAAAVLMIARLHHLDTPAAGGLLAGAQTQPAVLAFANEGTSSPRLMVNYAIATPIAMVVKIIAAQLLILL
jgi:putative transport protein